MNTDPGNSKDVKLGELKTPLQVVANCCFRQCKKINLRTAPSLATSRANRWRHPTEPALIEKLSSSDRREFEEQMSDV